VRRLARGLSELASPGLTPVCFVFKSIENNKAGKHLVTTRRDSCK